MYTVSAEQKLYACALHADCYFSHPIECRAGQRRFDGAAGLHIRCQIGFSKKGAKSCVLHLSNPPRLTYLR